jgi:hypothetical protein
LGAGDLRNEAEVVKCLIFNLLVGAPFAVALIFVHLQEEWPLARDIASCLLQLCNVFITVAGHDPVIMVSCSDEEARISDGLDGVERRVREQVL